MTDGLRDNRASVPAMVRSLITHLWGASVMGAFDRHGRKHDRRLLHEMPRRKADRMLVADMLRDPLIPWQIVAILWPALRLYAALPKSISRIYWTLI